MAPRRFRPVAAIAAALLLSLVLAASAQASVLGPQAGHSPNANSIRTAYWVMIVVATILAVAVNAALVVALLRFREGRGREPRQVTAGRGAILRAGIPLALVVAAVFVFGVVKTDDVRSVVVGSTSSTSASNVLTAQVGLGSTPGLSGLNGPATETGQQPVSGQTSPATGPLTINAIGQQWLWRFEYPTATQQGPPFDVFTYNTLVVPVDTTVILSVASSDVLHRYFVPALGGQVDAVPGETSQTWFRADREGVYGGQSTSFSGTGYSVMRIWVRVVSQQAYQQFLTRKRHEIAAAQAITQKKIASKATVGGVTLP